MPPPHIRTIAEHALDLVPAGAALLQHLDAGEMRRAEERAPDVRAERDKVASVRAATVAAAARNARQRPVAISTSGIITPNCGL